MRGPRESPVMAVETGKRSNHMKSINEFDAEALRTGSYGFLAAAFFGDADAAVRFFFLAISIVSYFYGRYLISVSSKRGKQS